MLIERVEYQLEQLVRILVREVPELREVRVYGSYGTARWDSAQSDIDVVAFTGDERLSVDRDTQRTSSYREMESRQRQSLRRRVMSQLDGPDASRILLALVTRKDLKWLRIVNEGRGYLGREMERGRLIYQKTNS